MNLIDRIATKFVVKAVAGINKCFVMKKDTKDKSEAVNSG